MEQRRSPAIVREDWKPPEWQAGLAVKPSFVSACRTLHIRTSASIVVNATATSGLLWLPETIDVTCRNAEAYKRSYLSQRESGMVAK